MGVDEVVSAGLNTEVDVVLGFDIPSKSNTDRYLYAQGSVGVEAKFLDIFDTDFEIFFTDKSYIWGEPTDAASLQAFESFDLSQATWKPMSRDYLYKDSAQLLAVNAGSSSQSYSNLATTYPAADVQTADLPNGGLLVVWTHDPGESVRPCANNRPMLYYAYHNGSYWSYINPVFAPDDGTAASGETLWYAWKDENGSHLCSFDGTAATPLSPEALNASRPSFVDGVLTWYADGAVVENGNLIPLEESTDRYQYLSSGTGIQAILYTVPGNDRYTSLCASFNDGSGWGEPIIIAGGSNHITSFHGQFLSDGTLKIATLGQAVTFDGDVSPVLSSSAALQIYQISLIADLAVTDIDYLAHSLVKGGTLDLHLQLENQGAVGIQCVKVDIMRGSTVYATQTYHVDLASGESTSLFVPFPLPSSIMSSYYAKVTPVGLTDEDTIDNTGNINLRLQDVSVEDTLVVRSGESLEVVTTVASRGIQAVSDVTVTLTDEAGTVLGTCVVESLNAGDNTFCRFTVTQDLPEGSILTVTASELETENISSNNSRTVLVPKKEKTAFHLTASQVTTEDQTSVMVTAINPTDSAVSCLLYCASYDTFGKMLHISPVAEVSCPAGSQAIYQLDLKADADAAEIRLFTMTGSYVPYLDVITLK